MTNETYLKAHNLIQEISCLVDELAFTQWYLSKQRIIYEKLNEDQRKVLAKMAEKFLTENLEKYKKELAKL